MTNTSKTIAILTTLSMLAPISLMAQGAPPATPIDGGLSLLLAAAGIYGVKRLIRNRK